MRAPPAARSSSSRTTSAGSGDGRAVTTTSNAASGSCRATDKIANRLALSAQWMSSATSSTGRSAHDVSTRSTISSTTRYWMSPAAAPAPRRPGRPAARRSQPCAGPVTAGSDSSAAATTPNGRVRSKGCAWPQNTATSRERASSTMLCTRRVLPMPASPSIASTDARPSLSWRTAAAASAELGLPPHQPLRRGHPHTPPPRPEPPPRRCQGPGPEVGPGAEPGGPTVRLAAVADRAIE